MLKAPRRKCTMGVTLQGIRNHHCETLTLPQPENLLSSPALNESGLPPPTHLLAWFSQTELSLGKKLLPTACLGCPPQLPTWPWGNDRSRGALGPAGSWLRCYESMGGGGLGGKLECKSPSSSLVSISSQCCLHWICCRPQKQCFKNTYRK